MIIFALWSLITFNLHEATRLQADCAKYDFKPKTCSLSKSLHDLGKK